MSKRWKVISDECFGFVKGEIIIEVSRPRSIYNSTTDYFYIKEEDINVQNINEVLFLKHGFFKSNQHLFEEIKEPEPIHVWVVSDRCNYVTLSKKKPVADGQGFYLSQQLSFSLGKIDGIEKNQPKKYKLVEVANND